jgi:hypothetical protein
MLLQSKNQQIKCANVGGESDEETSQEETIDEPVDSMQSLFSSRRPKLQAKAWG